MRFGELIMTAGCEANPGMAALKKANEAKYKAICTGMREDGAFIEAGENDNLIVQKLAANPSTLGFFGYSFLEENTAKLKGVAINGVAPTYESISSLQISGRPSALHLRQECARPAPSRRSAPSSRSSPRKARSGPNGYLRQRGLIAAPTPVRASSRRPPRATSTPVNFAELK